MGRAQQRVHGEVRWRVGQGGEVGQRVREGRSRGWGRGGAEGGAEGGGEEGRVGQLG